MNKRGRIDNNFQNYDYVFCKLPVKALLMEVMAVVNQ